MTERSNGFRRGLLVSVSFPAALVIAAQANAQTAVVIGAPVAPATSTTATEVNGRIAAAAAADRNLKITVSADAKISNPGQNVTLSPTATGGNGAITFDNAGLIGTSDPTTNAVSDAVGVRLNGAGQTTKDNSVVATNAGRITNGLTATNFGADVSVANSGVVIGGINATGYGNVAVTSGGTGSGVATGGINATAFQTSTTGTMDGVTKTTVTGGTAKISATSDVGTTASKGAISANSVTDSSATVSALAGAVNATTNPTFNSTSQSAPAAAGKTVTTSQSAFTVNPGNATVTIATGGNVDSVQSVATTNSIVNVAGKVGNSVSATYFGANDSTFKQTTTQNAAGGTTQTTADSTFTDRGPASKVSVSAGGSVGGGAFASGITSAAVSNAGTITGGTSASTFGTGFTSSQTTNRNDAGAITSTRAITTQSVSGGAAMIDIAQGGLSQGFVSASGDGGASVINAGTIGTVATPVSVFASSTRNVQILNDVSTTFTDAGAIAAQVSKVENKTLGGAVSVTNTADGLISTTGISASGVGPVTLVNAGTVRGSTSGSSSGTDSVTDTNFTSSTTTTAPAAPALPVTTASTSRTTNQVVTQIGSSVTGTYSGVNGTLNFSTTPPVIGSISQFATTDSVATISGTVFGSVNSTGGAFGSNSTSLTQNDTKRVTDTAGVGTNTVSTSSTSSFIQVAGSGTVNVTGRVGLGDSGVTPSVSVSGSKAATAAITNGTLEGSLSVNSFGVRTQSSTSSNGYTQALAAFTPTSTTALTNATATKSTVTDGVATATITGTSTTGTKTSGFVVVSGNSATATVGTGSKIGTTASPAGLFVNANSFDSSSSDSVTYARDPATTVTNASSTTTSASGPAATAGNAVATVAGVVTGATNVFAGGGNATATINGVTGSVSASTGNTNFTSTTTNTYSGKTAATLATSFNSSTLDSALSAIKTGQTTTTSITSVGGKAAVVVDSSDAVKATIAPNNIGVTGSIFASGIGGATVTVTNGSLVGSSASVFSLDNGSSSQTTNTYNAGVLTSTSSTSATPVVGGSAVVTNAGAIAGKVFTQGAVSAEIANTGKLGTIGFGTTFSADAIGVNATTTVTDTTINNAAARNQVTKLVQTASNGTAKFTNGATGVVLGSVSLAGGTGTFTNDGTVVGTTTLGRAVNDYTLTTTKTASSTTQVISQPASLFAQTYTVNQNGTSGGFTVTGATIMDPTDPTMTRTLQTSNVSATINLNNGSATIGDIIGQPDAKTNARLTTTTVNLNGAGFLGADFVIPTTGIPTTILPVARVTPELTLTKDATTNSSYTIVDTAGNARITSYAGSNGAVRVTGVTTLAKTGAGTFVITGQPYLSSTTPGVVPIYTLDVGNFNINAGEVQLALGTANVVPTGYTAMNEFGINGNVTNNGSLVLGRRTPTILSQVGSSLVGTGPERIAGITVRQVGNFTQGSGGTLVVGATPSLVRFGNVTVNNTGTSSEALGVVTSGVTVPYFTTVQNAGVAIPNSTLNVTGNLTLGGTVLVEVSRDSLFSTGDGYTLASYTGTGTVTATASTTLSSPFVKFALVNDAATKTVRLNTTRTSFATAATDRNSVAAATALDSAIATVVGRIRTDAAGGAGFASVSQIGFAQDIANIVTALDFRLSGDQAAQLFRELSSAELYGSLSSVNQNVVFGDTINQLTARRAYGEALGARLWLTPVGTTGKYGGQKYGASRIRVNSFGIAGGLDLAYTDDGAFGIGAAYGKHNVNTLGNPDKADINTYTLGAYLTQGVGDFYVNGTFAYGFSRFHTSRQLVLLARTINGSFHGSQLDAALEGGYDFKTGDFTVTPFAKAALRRYSMNSFNETNGGGVALGVQKRSKSIFSPVVGVKVGAAVGDLEGLSVRPYGKVSYTFQGDLGEDRTVQFLGGGDSFKLYGVDPRGYGTAELGLDGSLTPRTSVFLSGGYSFAGHNDVATLRGGIGIKF